MEFHLLIGLLIQKDGEAPSFMQVVFEIGGAAAGLAGDEF